MTRNTRLRLFSVLVLLGVLMGILATPTEQSNAYAGICCEVCDTRLQNCFAGITFPECMGDTNCCYTKVTCWSSCNPAC